MMINAQERDYLQDWVKVYSSHLSDYNQLLWGTAPYSPIAMAAHKTIETIENLISLMEKEIENDQNH